MVIESYLIRGTNFSGNWYTYWYNCMVMCVMWGYILNKNCATLPMLISGDDSVVNLDESEIRPTIEKMRKFFVSEEP